MILVTGATGNVGKEVVKGLIKEMLLSKSQRAVEKLKEYILILKPLICKGTLTGVTKVFLIRPPHLADAKNISSLL